jgi:hypothetical protein
VPPLAEGMTFPVNPIAAAAPSPGPVDPSGRGGGGTPPGSPAVHSAPRLRRFCNKVGRLPLSGRPFAKWRVKGVQTLGGGHSFGRFGSPRSS